jgi:predicted esterase
MGALFTCQHPLQVRKLVLLAPALTLPEFAASLPAPVDVPTIIIHGAQDDIVPLEPTRKLATQVFRNLEHHSVEDGHRLENTAMKLDWQALLA